MADPSCYTDDAFLTLKPMFAYCNEVDANIKIGIEHVEGELQNHREMLDGLGDTAFTVFFMAIFMGHNLTPMIREITASNFTKLDEDGNPIINGKGKAALGQPLHRSDQPIGKILKGPHYVPPALDRLFGHNFPKGEL